MLVTYSVCSYLPMRCLCGVRSGDVKTYAESGKVLGRETCKQDEAHLLGAARGELRETFDGERDLCTG